MEDHSLPASIRRFIMNVTEEDFEKIILEIPGLVCWGLSIKKQNERYYRGRVLLYSSFSEFKICVKWLSLCKKRLSVNRKLGSCDSLRHAVSGWANREIPTGALLAAVYHLRITTEEFNDFPKVYVALSSRCPFLKRSLKMRGI